MFVLTVFYSAACLSIYLIKNRINSQLEHEKVITLKIIFQKYHKMRPGLQFVRNDEVSASLELVKSSAYCSLVHVFIFYPGLVFGRLNILLDFS